MRILTESHLQVLRDRRHCARHQIRKIILPFVNFTIVYHNFVSEHVRTFLRFNTNEKTTRKHRIRFIFVRPFWMQEIRRFVGNNQQQWRCRTWQQLSSSRLKDVHRIDSVIWCMTKWVTPLRYSPATSTHKHTQNRNKRNRNETDDETGNKSKRSETHKKMK